MLTVCIPIYNYDCIKLISDLNNQADNLECPVEIVVLNDGSKPEFNNLYDSLFLPRVRYISLPQNIGRSKVRNLFVSFAKYDYMLFLDCDIEIISVEYLKKYLLQITLGCDVVCGGTKYNKNFPGLNWSVHWNYETKKERELFERRKKYPYEAFMTNNFLIRKDVFFSIKFNETLEQYGHEDTLFGYELSKARIAIRYIDNPVLHGDLNDNLTFLKKTDLAIQNLVAILKFTKDKEFVKSISLLRVYFRLKRADIIYLLKPFETSIAGFCYKRLLAGSANLTYLNLYKLCLFAKYYRSRN